MALLELLGNILSVAIALLAITLAYYKWTFQYWKRKNVHYLEPSIPFGNVVNPFGRTISQGDDIHNLYKIAKAKGWKHFGIFNLTVPYYVVMDLDIAKAVLARDFANFTDKGMYTNEKDDPIGAHIFSVKNPKWKNLRTKFSPTFTSGKLKMMFQIMVDNGAQLEKFIEKCIETSGGLLNIKYASGCFTVDNIASCAFGLDCNSFEKPNTIKEHGDMFFMPSNLQSIKSTFNFNFPNAARALGFRDVPKHVSDFFTNIVTDAVLYREKNNYSRKDFLQSMIELKNNGPSQKDNKGEVTPLTMNEIVAQCFVMFLGGYETSATTTTFAMFELALHQDMQDKVRKEIKEALAKHDDQITYESLNEMKYTTQVIDETLRKYPPVTFVPRIASEAYKIPGADIILDAGSRLIIPIKGYHYDEEYFSDPETFDPERFSAENKRKRHPYAHMPFGAGPRFCIGDRFGMIQIQVALATILRSFKVSLNSKTELPLKMNPNAMITSYLGDIWLTAEKI